MSFNVQVYTVIIYTTWQVMYEIFKFTPVQINFRQAQNEKETGRYIIDFKFRHYALAAAL